KRELEKKLAERKKAQEARAAQVQDGKGRKRKSKAPPEKKLLAFHIAPSHAADLIANTKMSLVELQTAVDAGAPAKTFKLEAQASASIKERKEPATITA